MAHLLVVDDEPSARSTLALLLRKRGHHVIEADGAGGGGGDQAAARGGDADEVVGDGVLRLEELDAARAHRAAHSSHTLKSSASALAGKLPRGRP